MLFERGIGMKTPIVSELSWKQKSFTIQESLEWELPMVEVFETIEGEGSRAGYPTVFVRVFHCNLRCTWCDTPYSYAPAKPEYNMTIQDLVDEVKGFKSRHLCFTGGEPLIHREKSAAFIHQLSLLDNLIDIHIETNGAIELEPFARLRETLSTWKEKVRFIMDVKLPQSGESDKMIMENFRYLKEQDEIKFVIGSDSDFDVAVEIINNYYQQGIILMSPVWETMPPKQLVEKVLAHGLAQVKVSLQLHKIIWDPNQRGV